MNGLLSVTGVIWHDTFNMTAALPAPFFDQFRNSQVDLHSSVRDRVFLETGDYCSSASSTIWERYQIYCSKGRSRHHMEGVLCKHIVAAFIVTCPKHHVDIAIS